MPQVNPASLLLSHSFYLVHCKPGQVEAAYIEYGNSAAAMQVSQVNLFDNDNNNNILLIFIAPIPLNCSLAHLRAVYRL